MLSFEEEVQNAIGCMEYWEERVGEYINSLNEVALSEDECVMEDTQKSLEFIRKLPSIIGGACVLACYAGEDWAARQEAFDFGADGYEYVDKYINGAMQLSDVYGKEDFHNNYEAYYKDKIKPGDKQFKRVMKIGNDKYLYQETYKGFAIYEEQTPSGYLVHQSFMITDGKLTVVSQSYNNNGRADMLDAIDNYVETKTFGFKILLSHGIAIVHPSGDISI